MYLWTFKIDAYDQTFFAVLEINNGKLIGSFRAFMNKNEASKFTHEILIRKTHHTYGWRSRCMRLHLKHSSIVRSGECLIMDSPHLEIFEDK